jgi:hypothetical protein
MSEYYSPTKPKRTVSGYMQKSINGCLSNVAPRTPTQENVEKGLMQSSSPTRSPSRVSAPGLLTEGTSALQLTGDRLQVFNSIRVLGDHLSRGVVSFLIRHVGKEQDDEKINRHRSVDSDDEDMYSSDDGQKKLLLKGAAYLHNFNGAYAWDASKANVRKSRRPMDKPGLGAALATLDNVFTDKRKVGAFGLLAANDAVGTTEQTYRRQKRVTRTQTSIQLLLQTYEWTEQAKEKTNGNDAARELSNKGVPPAEKHECALLFVDISGFTKLSTLLPIEQLSKVSYSYHNIVNHVVVRLWAIRG